MRKIENIGIMMSRKSGFYLRTIFLVLLAVVVSTIVLNYLSIHQKKYLLKERAASYFEAEKNSLWEVTYGFRPHIFRKVISLEEYSERMRRDSRGWELVRYSIGDVYLGKDRAKVIVKVVHRIPENFPRPPNVTNNEMNFMVTTRWVRANNAWYVEDAGVRLHLSYNGAMVKE